VRIPHAHNREEFPTSPPKRCAFLFPGQHGLFSPSGFRTVLMVSNLNTRNRPRRFPKNLLSDEIVGSALLD